MPKSKTSIVKNFIQTALRLLKYPKSVYWVNEDRGLVCIHLLNQHNRVRARETTKMLEDYAHLRPRRHANDGGSNRQRFLQAIKRSPYIEILPRAKNPQTQDEKDKIFIYLKETNEMLPGTANTIGSELAAGPSGMNQTDASVVPQMIQEEHFENPPTPSMHESEEMTLDSTPTDATFVIPVSPLPDFDYVNMDCNLIGSENLIDNGIQCPVDPPTDRNPYSEVFSSVRMPDLSDVAALEDVDMDSPMSEDVDLYPSNYDPTFDLLQSLNLTQTLFGLEVKQASSSSANQRFEINEAWMIDCTENGIDLHGRVDSNGIDRPGSMFMVSLRPHQEPDVEPNQTRQS